jgi:UDP-N-acetylglucosamine 2-epimerase (non-hydrolysing)
VSSPDRHRLLVVAGARPNWVKLAPLVHELAGRPDRVGLHIADTGQHYDRALSEAFLEQLALPDPDVRLAIGSGSHAEQTAATLAGLEPRLGAHPPAAVVVAGDVNSTLGGALAAAQQGVPVVHLEAGLRSGDWTMPEELNRVLTDRMASLLLCPSADAVDNLRREGIEGAGVALVGNTMIDSLHALLPAARRTGMPGALGLEPRRYVLVTLHRPAVVDDPAQLRAALAALGEVARELPVVLPLHPRTRARMLQERIALPAGVRAEPPMEYLPFIALEESARLVVTDSGGVQEETSVLGVPCLTYRTTTERPVTVELGTNRVVGIEPDALAAACRDELSTQRSFQPADIPLWDGRAGPRAAEALLAWLG